MAKRFVDTDLFRKPLMRSLQAPYKVLWVYLLCECDHAGIWDVELDVAAMRLGTKFDHAKCVAALGDAIVQIDGGRKWWLPEFVSFQYGTLNPANKVHASALSMLAKHGINPNEQGATKGLGSSFEGAKDMDKEKDKAKDEEEETGGGAGEPKRKGPDPGVQGVIDHLTTVLREKNIARSLDVDTLRTPKGDKDGNRTAAYNLLQKLSTDYPGDDPLANAKLLIDWATNDEFHKAYCTKVRYLHKHCGTLIAQARQSRTNPKTQTNADRHEQLAAELAKRAEARATGNVQAA